MENRRKHLRIPITTVAHITPHGLQKSIEVFVRDVSTFGMGGYMNSGFNKGSMLLVKLKLLTANDETIEESIMGQIKWSRKLNRGGKYAFGLEFLEIQKDHPKLYLYLKELEEVLFPGP